MNPFLNIATSGKVNFEDLKAGSAGSGLLGGLLSADGLQGVVDHESMGSESRNFEQYLDNSTDGRGSEGLSKVWSTTLLGSEEADIAPIVTSAVQSSNRVLPQIISSMMNDSEQGDVLTEDMHEVPVQVENSGTSDYETESYDSFELEASFHKSEDVQVKQLLKEPVVSVKNAGNKEVKKVEVKKESSFSSLTRPIPLAPKGDFRATEPLAQISKENVVSDSIISIEPPEDSNQAEEVWSTTSRLFSKDIEVADSKHFKDVKSAEMDKPLIRPILESKRAMPAAKPVSAPTAQDKAEVEKEGVTDTLHESLRNGAMPPESCAEDHPEIGQYVDSPESFSIELNEEDGSLAQYLHGQPHVVSIGKSVEQESDHVSSGQGRSTSFQKVVPSESSHDYQPLTETAEQKEAGFMKPVPQKEVSNAVGEQERVPVSEVRSVEAKVIPEIKVQESAPPTEKVAQVVLQEFETAHQGVVRENPLPMPEGVSSRVSGSDEKKDASTSSIMSNAGVSLTHEVDQESLTIPNQIQPILGSSQSASVEPVRPADASSTYVLDKPEMIVSQQAMSQLEPTVLVSESAHPQEPVRVEDPALFQKPVVTPAHSLKKESLFSEEGSLTKSSDIVAVKETSRLSLNLLSQSVDQEEELTTELKDWPLKTTIGSRFLESASKETSSKGPQKSGILRDDVANDYRVSMDRMAAEEDDVVDEIDLSRQQKLERLVAPYAQHKPERETHVQGRNKQVSASVPLRASVNTESSARTESSLRYEIPESGIQVSPDRSLSKKDIGMQELFRDLVQGMQNRDEASLNPELGKSTDVRALHSHSEKAETPFEPIPAMQNMNSKLMQQLEQFQRSQRPWAKLSLPMEEGEELMLSFKILDGRIQVRFGTQNSGLRETIERGWSDLIKMASIQGIVLDQPEFEGRLRVRGQVFQSAQRSDLNEDGSSKNSKRRPASIGSEGEPSASDGLDDYEGMLKWA
tara:strand:+ start:642 stop:3557 length:2916 start_codon:yes stop_codon:yes gene_type:complete